MADPITVAAEELAEIDPQPFYDRAELEVVEEQFAASSDDQAPAPTVVPATRLDELRVDWAEFWRRDHTAAQWLVEPVIAAGRNHSITAAGKTGKSLFVLTVLTPATIGRRTLDRPAGDPLRVLYLDYEMSEADVQERLVEMGHGAEFAPEAFAYVLHPPIPPLDTAAGGAVVEQLARQHRAEVVVIDTYSRAVSGEDDSSDTVRALYRHTITPLKAQGIAVLRLDHTGHKAQDRARGASGKGDDIDLGWLLRRTDDGFTLTASHARSGWMPEKVNVALDQDPLRARLGGGGWPAGTKEAATQFAELGLPLDASQRAAREALKTAGITMSSAVLRAGLKWRRTELMEEL